MELGPSSARKDLEAVRQAGDSQFGVLGLLNAILRRRALVVATVVLVELVMLWVALSRPRLYTSVVSFMPEGQRSNSGVSSLAAQFGVSVATTDGLSSPQFYPELIRSPQFLGAVLDGRYPDSASGKPLLDFLNIPAGDARVRRQKGIENLARNVVPSVGIRTGIVSVAVTATDPELAKTIAARVLAEIVRFNQHTRQGKAAAERQFIERRLASVRDSLRLAEERLLRFLQGNRDFSRSATLPFERTRLERDVTAQQLLLSTLGPSYEQARIEEVRDTPVLTILRQPEAPLWPNPRGRVRLLAIGLLGGLALGIALAFALDWWGKVRLSGSAEVQELSETVSRIRDDARQGRLTAALLGSNGQPAAAGPRPAGSGSGSARQ